jgi:hypothetical protein
MYAGSAFIIIGDLLSSGGLGQVFRVRSNLGTQACRVLYSHDNFIFPLEKRADKT